MNIEEKLQELNSKLARLEEYKNDVLKEADDLTKEKVAEIKEQSIKVLKEAIRKIEEVKDEGEKLDIEEVSDRISAKFNDAYYYSIHRIDDLLKINDKKNDFEEAINKFFNSEEFKAASDKIEKVSKDVYKQVEDFMNREETKEAIKKAKITTVKVAEKGLAALKKALNVEEEKSGD